MAFITRQYASILLSECIFIDRFDIESFEQFMSAQTSFVFNCCPLCSLIFFVIDVLHNTKANEKIRVIWLTLSFVIHFHARFVLMKRDKSRAS